MGKKMDDLLRALETDGPRGLFRELFKRRDEGVRFQQAGEAVQPPISRRIKKISFMVLGFVVGFIFLPLFFFSYLGPNERGRIKDNWGVFGARGIQTKDYGTGLVLVLPGQTLLRVPDHPVMLDFADHQPEANKEKGIEADYSNSKIYPLSRTRVQLSDGFYADNDFTVLVRVTNPYDAITTYGQGDAFVNGGLVPKVDPALKESLGRMTTEIYYKWPELRWVLANGSRDDFKKAYQKMKAEYDRRLALGAKVEPVKTTSKEEKTLGKYADLAAQTKILAEIADYMSDEERALFDAGLEILKIGTEKEISAKAILNRDLKNKGVEVILVAGRYFNFSTEIEKNIEQKVLKVQEAELNRSIGEYNDAQAKLAKVNAEGEQSLNVLKAVGEAYYTQKSGDTDKYVRTKEAAGSKLVGVAEAYKTRKTSAALDIPGASNWVNKETASALDNIGVMMITPGEYQKMINEWGKQ